MAKRTIEILTDDLDGTEIADGEGQTLRFAVGTATYELDLRQQNIDEFYNVLTPYMEKARKVAGRAPSTSPSTPATGTRAATRPDREQLQAAREWLRSQGHQVSDRGRIKADLMELYSSSH